MNSLVITVLLLYMAPVTFANEDINRERIIFGARCEARCFAMSQKCNETCTQSCNMPCRDTNFYKVKSCTSYCKKWVNSIQLHRGCKSSCKSLLKLYNTGGDKSKHHNSFKLPKRPKTVRSTLLNSKKKKTMLISWSSNNSKSVVFIIESRYIKVEPLHMSEWTIVQTSTASSIEITPRTAALCEYRVMSVNEHGTSDFSSPSKPIIVMPDRPSPPRHFRIIKMIRMKQTVSVTFTWSKPIISEVPIHRYRLAWSHRLDGHREELHDLRVYHQRIRGGTHSFTLNGLSLNTTYQFELRAIIHFNNQRLKSKRVILTRRMLDKEPVQSVKLYKNKKRGKPKVVKNSNLKENVEVDRPQTVAKWKVLMTTRPKDMSTEEKDSNPTTEFRPKNEVENTFQHQRNSTPQKTLGPWVWLFLVLLALLHC